MPNPILDRLNVAEAEAVPITPENLAGEIAAQAAKSQAAAEVNRDIQADILEGMQGQQAVITEAIMDTGTQNQILRKQANVAQMQQETNVNKAYATAGGQEALHNLIASRFDTVKEITVGAEAVNARMDKDITGIGMLDGILNVYASLGDRIRLEADQERLATIDNAIAGTAQTINAATSIEGQVKQTVTAATMAADQVKIANDASILAAKFQLDAAGSNAIQVQRVVNATSQQLDQLHKQAQLQNTLSAAGNADLRRKVLELQLEAMESEAGALDKKVAFVTAGMANLGDIVLDEDIIRQDLQDPKKAKNYNSYIEAGLLGYQGDNTGDAIANAEKKGGFANPEHAKMATQIKSKVPGKMDAAKLAKKGDKLAKGYHKTIVSGDPKNWYGFPGLEAMGEVNLVKNSELYTKILGPNPAAIRTHQDIIDNAVSAITANTISHKTAAQDIVNMFSAAKELNNGLKDYKGMRIPQQLNYNAEVTWPVRSYGTFLFGERIVDLTNITQVEQMLISLRVPRRGTE